MKDIRLYIADTLVDMDAEGVITMSYFLDDTSNPTIVKNNFSKSITLPCSARNNALFGRIYDLSRITQITDGAYSGVAFNSLVRTPFQLFVDGDLMESGYIQLTGIHKVRGIPTYSINLFGGLGDFFYNLMYRDNGDIKSLADLDFKLDGATDSATEMDFVINRDAVKSSWSVIDSGRNNLAEAITFVPAYNGVAKDFDSKHALVRLADAPYLPTTATDGGMSYGGVNGYGLLSLPRAMDEWEVRDLRSYLQRPALKVKSLFKALCDPDNNGGYNVVLDENFFNDTNALYDQAYITLPMLSNEQESEDVNIEVFPEGSYVFGGANNTYYNNSLSSVIDLSSYPVASTIKMHLPISVSVLGDDEPSRLFLQCTQYEQGYEEVDSGIVAPVLREVATKRSAFVAQMQIIDADNGSIIISSGAIALSNGGDFSTRWAVYSPLNDSNDDVSNFKGSLIRSDDSLYHRFIADNGANTFPLEVSFIKGNYNNVRVEVRVQRAYQDDDVIADSPNKVFKYGSIFDTDTFVEALTGVVNNVYYVNDNNMSVITDNLPSVASGSKITKQLLLGGTASPADYLLSYTKLFGLRYIKDVATKTITITNRYFVNEVVDMRRRIDHSDISIVPNVFDKKFMRLALDQPDTYFAKKYRNANKLDYGQKRVDTGYAFNNDTEEVYDGNVYTSAVPCLAISKAFYRYFTDADAEVFAPIAEGVELSLINGLNGIKKNTQYVQTAFISSNKTTALYRVKGYDAMPKMCYFEERDGEREAVDISNNLVIFCGGYTPQDAQGNVVEYTLSDDVTTMSLINDAPCYILTRDTTEVEVYSRLPLFLSYRLVGGRVYDSFDFATSKESYIPNITYPDTATLYERYWQGYYEDRMNVDTKRISVMCDLSGMTINAEAMRRFYYFDNNLWLLNAITDYVAGGDRLTRCEFIQVQNINSYYRGETLPPITTDGFTYQFDFKLD